MNDLGRAVAVRPDRVAWGVRLAPGAAGLLLLALAACSKPAPTTPAQPAAATTTKTTTAASAAAPTAAVPETVRKLLGRWMRSDGGYTLELRSADLSGVLDAGYFNPKSIRVSRAVWMQGGGGFQVAVELNDVGYPGATYLLNYDSQNDRLTGKYTQPAMQQSFDIEFVRQPK
jgi:ABC-type glycerol-3-phosphate transport system substrate-binding protein